MSLFKENIATVLLGAVARDSLQSPMGIYGSRLIAGTVVIRGVFTGKKWHCPSRSKLGMNVQFAPTNSFLSIRVKNNPIRNEK